METKIHLEFEDSGHACCSWNDRPKEVTKNVNEVTCLACLNGKVPPRTIEELRELVLQGYLR